MEVSPEPPGSRVFLDPRRIPRLESQDRPTYRCDARSTPRNIPMITGYNTDIRHGERVFHVQTEDKGTENPFIESLVYVGGQVLAAKRVSYRALLDQGSGDAPIVEMMERQHRTVIAAIRQGRLDGKAASVLGEEKPAQTGVVDALLEEGEKRRAAKPVPGLAPAPIPEPAPATTGSLERTLDQVILEYLTNEADQEQLLLTVDGDPRLGLGRSAELGLRTTSSKSGQPIDGAKVQVRMISTVEEPRVLATGETGGGGTLKLAFDVPTLDRGTAALIITAASSVGRAEIKHLL